MKAKKEVKARKTMQLMVIPPPPFAKLISIRRTIPRLAGLLAAILAAFTVACKQPTNAGSRGGGETPEEESIAKGISSLASLSIVCEGFPEDVAKNVYPDIKNFSGTQKYYLVPYPLGSAGKIKIRFMPKIGSALNTVLLDGFEMTAAEPLTNETDDEEEPVEEPVEEDGTPVERTYIIDVLSTDTAHKVEIALSNLDYGENITYTLNINGVNSTGGGMKEVAVPAGNSFEIPADLASGAYFAHIQFAGGPNRLKKLILSSLSVGVDVNVGLTGASGSPSKWKLKEDGSITVTQGNTLINAVYVGPKYYYDYLYAADEIDEKITTLRGLISDLSRDLEGLIEDVEGLGGGQIVFAESLLEEITVGAPVQGAGVFTYTLTGDDDASEYDFAYFKLSGGDIWHTVSLTAGLPYTVVPAPEVILAIAGDNVTVTVPVAGSVPAVELERFFLGTGEASYHTLVSFGEQLTALSGILADDYVTTEALSAALTANNAGAVTNQIAEALAGMISVSGVLRAAADSAAAGLTGEGGTFASLDTAALKITAVQAALSQVINSHDESIAEVQGALAALNHGEYGGSLNFYVDTITPRQPAHSVSFAFATAAATGGPQSTTAGYFISRLGSYTGSTAYDAYQTFIPGGSTRHYERHTTGGQSAWSLWERTDAASLNVLNVGAFSGGLNDFITAKNQPPNSTYFGYSTGTGAGLGKPAADTGAGFFTSETGEAVTVVHQTFRPADSTHVYERQTNNGVWGAPGNGWTRTDAAFVAENLTAQDVGGITTENCSGGLDAFVTLFSQPVGGAYTGSVAADVAGRPDGTGAGFFTSYRAAAAVSYQTFRPVGTTEVYERTENGGWGDWVRTDAGALDGAAENAAAALNVRNVGTFVSHLNSFVAGRSQPAYSTYFGYSTGADGKPDGADGTMDGFFTSEVAAKTSGTVYAAHQTFRPAGTTRVWERYTATGEAGWGAWTRTDAEAAAAALNVRNVGNIAPATVDSDLDKFAETYSQPAGSTYHAYFTGAGTSHWPASEGAGFFTSYVGTITIRWTGYVSRQEYRPANSNKVYERSKNGGGAWSGWERIDTTTGPAVPLSITATIPTYVATVGSMEASYFNGFVTIYIRDVTTPAIADPNKVLFTISGVNYTATTSNINMAFPVIFSTGTIRWIFVKNYGNLFQICNGWSGWPAGTIYGINITIPAVLIP